MNTMNTTEDILKKKTAGKIAKQRRDAEIAFLIVEAQHKADNVNDEGLKNVKSSGQ